MQKLSFDVKSGKAKVRIESADDLWYLSQLVDPQDVVRGKTYRKVKLSGEGEKAKVDKKPITLTIQVEKVELEDHALRINGTVTEPVDDIPKGSYHSLTVDEGYELMLIKEQWLSYQLAKFKEATTPKGKPLLLVIMDREEALLALTKSAGYTIVAKIKGDVQKKDDRQVSKGNFYEEIIQLMRAHEKKVDHIVLASPAFWKEDVLKQVDATLKKKIVLAQCFSSEENALQEVLRRPEVKTILQQERISKETQLVDQLLEQIAKQGKAAYGFAEVKEKAEAGAVLSLLVTDLLIKQKREKETFAELETVMKLVDKLKGEVHLISAQHEAGQKVQGLGGVAAILRY